MDFGLGLRLGKSDRSNRGPEGKDEARLLDVILKAMNWKQLSLPEIRD